MSRTTRCSFRRRVVLVLGLAQIPALLVTIPVVAYIWMSGEYGNASAIAYSVVLFAAGMADNVLKPLMLGRGVDAPMPVVLLGALGGMATAGMACCRDRGRCDPVRRRHPHHGGRRHDRRRPFPARSSRRDS